MIEIKKYFFQMAVILTMSMPIICLAGLEIQNNRATEKVGGTIPVIQKVYVSGEGYLDLFSSIDIEDFSRGFKETNEGKVILTVLANAAWKVSARAEFKPVGNYIKPASDFFIKIKDKILMAEEGDSGDRFNDAFVDFGSLSDEDQVLWMNDRGGDHCRARIDYRLLLNSAKDIPGDYGVTVTYTISTP